MEVYVVDPAADPQLAIQTILHKSHRAAFVYVPNRLRQAFVADEIKLNGGTLSLIPYETNNADFDDTLYQFAQAVSALVGRAICADGCEIDADVRWAFSVALQDKIVGRLRLAEQLRNAVRSFETAQIFYVPGPKYSDLWPTLQAAFPSISAITQPPELKFARMVMRVAGGGSTLKFNDQELAEAGQRKRHYVCGSVWDQQYRNTIFPVVHGLLKSGNPVCFVPSSQLPAASISGFLNQHHLSSFITNKQLVILEKTERAEPIPTRWETLLSLSKFSPKALRTKAFEHYVSTYGSLVEEIVAQETLRIVSGSALIFQQFNTLAPKMSSVTVCPGRHLRANLLVAAAKRAGIPTTEIQSGTISKSRRFVPPPSDTVLCMDGHSADTYRYLGKKSGLKVVGSVRLDHDLAAYRGISRQEARETLHIDLDSKLWVLATQPTGVPLMEAVVRIVLEAARSEGASVLIKQHPNETPEYAETYRSISRQYPDVRATIDQETKSVLACIAADVVFTYFSTVGIESYALKRLTIAVNPTDRPPSFDLVSMGVARSASSAADIIAIVAEPSEQFKVEAALTDGRALKRCVGHILKQRTRGSLRPITASKGDVHGKIMPLLPSLHRGLAYPWRILPTPLRKPLYPLAKAVRNFLIPGKRRK